MRRKAGGQRRRKNNSDKTPAEKWAEKEHSDSAITKKKQEMVPGGLREYNK